MDPYEYELIGKLNSLISFSKLYALYERDNDFDQLAKSQARINEIVSEIIALAKIKEAKP